MSEAGKRKTSWVVWVVFLLIVLIVVVMMFLAVGGKGENPPRRATFAQLKVLQMLMKDYIAKGNAEPGVVTPWIYDAKAPAAFAETLPASDLVEWVAALKSDPGIAKKLDAMPGGTDRDVPKVAGRAKVNDLIFDAYGNPIRYVPSDAKTGRAGYFMSAGPDGKFSMMVPAAGTAMRADEIFSTDPG